MTALTELPSPLEIGERDRIVATGSGSMGRVGLIMTHDAWAVSLEWRTRPPIRFLTRRAAASFASEWCST